MHKQTRNWVMFTVMSYVLMFILVPARNRKKILSYGICFGLIHAILLNWLAVKKYRLWKLPGDILIAGIPVLTCISWVPPAVIFAHYFPVTANVIQKVKYIVLFAFGTTVTQYIQGVIGMWQSNKWKWIYTFPLAIITHTIMTVGVHLIKIKD